MRAETKTGLFFIAGIMLLAVLTFQLEDFSRLFSRRYEIHALVGHAAGLEVGDKVAIAGVSVGIVKSMELRNGKVDVALLIDKKYYLHEGAEGSIAWSGLLGTKYVDITTGEPDAPVIEAGGLIPMKEAYKPETLLTQMDGALTDIRILVGQGETEGIKALPEKMNKALTSITALTEDLRAGKGTIGKLLADEELYGKLQDAVENMRQASAEALKIVKDNSNDIQKLVADISAASPDLKEAAASIRKIADQAQDGKGPLMKLLTDEKMGQDMEKTFANLTDFAAKLEGGQGLLKRLATDRKLAADLSASLENLRKVSTRLERGRGSAAMFLRDDKAYKEFQTLLAEARDLLRSVKEQIPVGAFGSVISGAF